MVKIWLAWFRNLSQRELLTVKQINPVTNQKPNAYQGNEDSNNDEQSFLNILNIKQINAQACIQNCRRHFTQSRGKKKFQNGISLRAAATLIAGVGITGIKRAINMLQKAISVLMARTS